MEFWQVSFLTFVVVLPLALLFSFWPENDRLTSKGRPVERDWIRQIEHEPAGDDHL